MGTKVSDGLDAVKMEMNHLRQSADPHDDEEKESEPLYTACAPSPSPSAEADAKADFDIGELVQSVRAAQPSLVKIGGCTMVSNITSVSVLVLLYLYYHG